MTEVPEEFRGVKSEMIEQNIRRLEIDMKAEIATISERYRDKIDNLQSVLKIARTLEEKAKN